METITIGQTALAITFVVGLITGISFLHKKLKEGMVVLLKDEFKALDAKFTEIDKQLKKLETRIDGVDMESCKNFLVSKITHIEKGDPLGDVEQERFWEQYDYYTKHQGNSYIRHKVEQLKEDGKI